jgi:hypothetical protein
MFTARSFRASDKEIVADRIDLQSECDCVERAGLADHAFKQGYIGGGQRELVGIDVASEALGRDRELLV